MNYEIVIGIPHLIVILGRLSYMPTLNQKDRDPTIKTVQDLSMELCREKVGKTGKLYKK